MSNEHTVKSYEEELQFLKDSLIKMGSLTESQLSDASQTHFQQNLIEVKPFAIPKLRFQQSPLQLIRLVHLV